MPTLTLDGRPLHYLDEGRGTPVVLLHAFPLHAGMFRPQVEALRGRCRLLLPDVRGFGGSGQAPGPTGMDVIARDVLALLDALGVERAVVGGVSMGGYAALALLREDPGRVAGLVLADTQALADDEAGQARREQVAREVEREGVEPLVRAMLPRLLGPDAPAGVRAEVEALMRQAAPAAVAAASRGMGARADGRDLLARFGGPALVLVGEHDAVTPLERARQMQELVPGARLVQVPGAGHLASLENPGAFNAALADFLAALP
jgi:pimeloyl-ACP methyl ester carboxylesterase